MPRLSLAPLLAVVALVALAACAHTDRAADASGKLVVATTFSTLNSFAEAVGGDHVEVHNIVPVGASPEEFQPTPQDIMKLSQARVLVQNGGGIESWLDRMVDNVQNPNLVRVTCTDGVILRNGNPHAWMDPQLAAHYVDNVRDALIKADPANSDDYRANAAKYQQQLVYLELQIQKQIATIPPEHRVMIVFHSAWDYYDARFGIRNIGVIEKNPGQDPNPQDLAKLIDLAKSNGVRAVFAEPEYSPKLAQALAQSAGIKTVSDLYDDSIAQSGRVKDYISMLRYDTDVIVKALH